MTNRDCSACYLGAPCGAEPGARARYFLPGLFASGSVERGSRPGTLEIPRSAR